MGAEEQGCGGAGAGVPASFQPRLGLWWVVPVFTGQMGRSWCPPGQGCWWARLGCRRASHSGLSRLLLKLTLHALVGSWGTPAGDLPSQLGGFHKRNLRNTSKRQKPRELCPWEEACSRLVLSHCHFPLGSEGHLVVAPRPGRVWGLGQGPGGAVQPLSQRHFPALDLAESPGASPVLAG